MTPLDGSRASTAARSPHGATAFLQDAVAGLRSTPKRISPKYFYDSEGALLFDAISPALASRIESSVRVT